MKMSALMTVQCELTFTIAISGACCHYNGVSPSASPFLFPSACKSSLAEKQLVKTNKDSFLDTLVLRVGSPHGATFVLT